jgi:large repetitive protein
MILALLFHLLAQQIVLQTAPRFVSDPAVVYSTLECSVANGCLTDDKIFELQAATTASSPFTFTIPIPAGCTGVISGSNVVITCTPVVVVTPPPPPPPPPALKIITPVTLPAGKVGVAYSIDISKLAIPTGGVAPYIYSSGANFPSWLKLSSTGILSGTPTAAGAFSIQFNVTDSSKTTTTTSSSSIPATINITSPTTVLLWTPAQALN